MYPPVRMPSTAWNPAWSRFADAPTTATVAGVSRSVMDRASARCSRAAITASDFSVGSMSKSTTTTPSSN